MRAEKALHPSQKRQKKLFIYAQKMQYPHKNNTNQAIRPFKYD